MKAYRLISLYKLQTVMRINYYFFFLAIGIFFANTPTNAQTSNFEETWKEFLVNNKISNMSALAKPNKQYEAAKYAKYLLMNTNTNFCQSKVETAEELMAEVQAIDVMVYKPIEGFVDKKKDLESKIEAYYSVDAIWKQFLLTKEVDIDQLDAIEATKSICEKRTLAKYSYMRAYNLFCEGEIAEAKNIFENRTLRLTEKTSLRVKDVEGLAKEVRTMKQLFQDMEKLDVNWKQYLRTGVSPGFDIDLPLFPCYPIPNMKEFVLKGVADVCSSGTMMLEKIKQLEEESGVDIDDRDLIAKIKELEGAIQANEDRLAALNTAWEAFIPDNKVKHMGQFGYEYCEKEPLIRAYIMDGFAYICEMGEDMLQKIDELQGDEITPLEDITMIKINELAELTEQYRIDGQKIEKQWDSFIAQGDRLTQDYESAELYCDNIHQVKDWAMRGLTASCEEGHLYLEQIENFQATFEFNFTEELECKVQKLRIAVWDCRYEALDNLARIEAEASVDETYEQRLEKLLAEYGMQDRPEVCPLER